MNWILILTGAVVVSILNMLHVIIGFAKTGPGMVYLWTGHYYLDYFEYVQAIAQGIWGRWIWENPYTTESLPTTFFGIWQNLLYGKIGGLFHLTPIVIYWLAVFVFSLVFALLIFQVIRKLLPEESFYKQVAAFLLGIFAAPFSYVAWEKGVSRLVVFRFWNDKATFFDRFGSIPYHLCSYILALVSVLIVADSLNKLTTLTLKLILFRVLIISLIIVYLITFAPVIALLLAIAICLTGAVVLLDTVLKKRTKYCFRLLFFLVMFSVIVLPMGMVIKNYLAVSYYAEAIKFETSWQVHPKITDFLLTTGPILILAFFGLFNYFRRLTPIRIIFLALVSASYFFFFSTAAVYIGTTNTRFLTPFSYILFGVLAVLWIKNIKPLIIITIIALTLFLPANIEALKSRLNDRNIASPISYLSKDTIDGFKFLNTLPDKKAVLLTPCQFLGSVLPIFADRHVYVARHNTTPNYLERNIIANNFYLGNMSTDLAYDFLQKNGLGYVVLTSIEGYAVKDISKYPFLKEIYKNRDIIIFKVT